MGENDILSLDANFTRWKQTSGAGYKGDAFLFYVIDQFLKSFHLSDSEIAYGITDGSNDGGIDGFYFFINGELIREDTDVDDKTAERVNLVIFQVKNANEGFKPTEIDKLYSATDDILTLSAPVNPDKYRKQLVTLFSSFKDKYKAVSGNLPDVSIDYYYITRGDEAEPNALAQSSIAKVKAVASKHLSKAAVNFHTVNAQGLLEQLRKRPAKTKNLNWTPGAVAKAPKESGYFGLVDLPEYFKFITENGELLRRYFDSNVRGFWKTSPQNKKIMESLESPKFDFWQLNNGITILSRELGTQGFDSITIRDPQIVNGLQTSRSIFNYFHAYPEKLKTETRKILVRVIETKDKTQQNAIIFATNNQNKMPPSALRATDEIQARIEELFEQFGLYYDRRKGVHKDEGRPIAKIVSIEEVSQSFVSIVLQRPKEARGRPGDYLKEDDKYREVFNDTHPLPVFLKCTILQRKVGDFLDSANIDRGDIRNIQFYLSSFLICEFLQHPEPNAMRVSSIDPDSIPNELYSKSFAKVWKEYEKLGKTDQVAKGSELQKTLQSSVRRRFNKKLKAKVAAVNP